MIILSIVLSILSLLLSLFILFKLSDALKSIGTWRDSIDKNILRILRSLTPNQALVYSSTICDNCKTLLPEGTIKTHDGRYLCSTCKVIPESV